MGQPKLTLLVATYPWQDGVLTWKESSSSSSIIFQNVTGRLFVSTRLDLEKWLGKMIFWRLIFWRLKWQIGKTTFPRPFLVLPTPTSWCRRGQCRRSRGCTTNALLRCKTTKPRKSCSRNLKPNHRRWKGRIICRWWQWVCWRGGRRRRWASSDSNAVSLYYTNILCRHMISEIARGQCYLSIILFSGIVTKHFSKFKSTSSHQMTVKNYHLLVEFAERQRRLRGTS